MLNYLDLSQLMNLGIATLTNVGSIYLAITYLYWTKRLRNSRTSLRPLIASMALAKGALWFWTFSNMLNIMIGDVDLPLETLPARFLWLAVIIVQVWVTTRIRPAPMLPESLETEWDRDGRLVLIVEDNEGLARVYRRALESVGINAEFATTGTDALVIIGMETPRLMVVDLALPDMNGVELVTHARAAGYKGPIVAISGAAGLIDIEKVVGFDHIVAKPIHAAELVGVVQRWAG